MAIKATLPFPSPTANDQVAWRVEYVVNNGEFNRPVFEVSVQQPTFDLPHETDTIPLKHGDVVSVAVYAKDEAGNYSVGSTPRVFTVQDNVAPSQPDMPGEPVFTQL